MSRSEMVKDKFQALTDEIEAHDFLHSYSDDHRVWKAGVEHQAKIEKMIKELGDIDEDFELVARHLFTIAFRSRHPDMV